MAVSAGTAALQVVPQLAKQFSRDLVTQMAGPANRAADKTGRQAGQRLGRQFEHAGDDSARRYGVRFNKRLGAGFSASSKIASVAAGAIGGAFAAVQIGGFLKDAITEAREAAKVGRQTAAVIKATGGVARVSAGDVSKLADRLSGLAGVDDEVIATGANMLLTFKNVRNEVGKGNNIFDRASVAALDMTAAMGKGVVTQEGLQASTIRLGKALNDPLKGMTALTKVGVTFTQGQKDQIAALVEAGDTMGAQQIILEELATEFGGAAKAAADPWQRVGVVMGNVKEDIGTLLLPAIESAATFITEKLVPGVRGFVEEHGPAFRDIFDQIKMAVTDFFTAVRDNLEPQLARIKQAWDDNREALGLLIGEFDKGTGSADAGADAVRSFGDAMVGLITTAGNVSSAMKTAEGYINGFNDTLATVGGAIHRIFVVPMYQAFQDVANAALTMNQKMIGGAATVAEALHLPMAAGLRKAEQSLGGFKDDFNHTMDLLKNEDVKITAGFGWQGLEVFQTKNGKAMFAAGGMVHGPGTGTSDSIPARLSKGEYVVRARAVRAVGRDTMDRINAQGFAAGGAVLPELGLPPAGQLTGKLAQFQGNIQRVLALAATAFKNTVTAMGGGPGIQRALGWARSQVGKPYIWGGVGPGGYDCSGFMSAIANVVSGSAPHRRLFATGTFPTAGWAPGFSPIGFSIGSRRGSPGHMAGTLGGVNVESRGSRGVVVGGGARGARDSLFGGNIWHLAGRSGGAGGEERWAGFDQGGWLMPGTTIARNNTGTPERVVGPGETLIDYQRLGRAVAAALAEQPPQVLLDGRRMDKQLATAKVWNERR